MKKSAVVLLSGGLDSAVCLWEASREYQQVLALHFAYHQKNQNKEFVAAKQLTGYLNSKLIQLDSRPRIRLFPIAMPIFDGSSAIVVGGHGKMDEVSDLIVPGRNAVFLSIAFSYAAQFGCTGVYMGAKRSEFPDCQPDFLKRMETALNMGLGYSSIGSHGVTVELPLLGWGRKQVVDRAIELGVPIEVTWSCYENGEFPCGKCGACLDRAKGFV